MGMMDFKPKCLECGKKYSEPYKATIDDLPEYCEDCGSKIRQKIKEVENEKNKTL